MLAILFRTTANIDMNSQKSLSDQPFWTLTRVGLVVSAILLIAAIASAFYPVNDTLQTNVDNAQPGLPGLIDRPLSEDPGGPAMLSETVMQASFKFLDGKSRRLSDYSGKVLVVDLWATWCGPCRQEIPHLVEMAREYKSKGVEIIGLTTEDPETDAELVKDFSKEFQINYPIGWVDPTMADGLTKGRNGIPQTIIIGRDGKIKKHFVGFNPYSSVPQIKAVLDEAVGAG